MIGRAEWFERRKYGGWGIHPKTWQGWVYLAFVFIPFIIVQSLDLDTRTRIIATIVWVVLLMIDVSHIMVTLKKDEREYRIEAVSERNAAWAMMLVMVVGALYQLITSAMAESVRVDWFLVAALFGGLIAKTVSNMYLERAAI